MPPQEFDTPEHQGHKIKYDATINLGHILTFVGFLVSGTGMYMSIANRVVVLEEARAVQVVTDHRQDTSIDDGKKTVREDLKGIDQKLDRLMDKLVDRKGLK